jgi:hypothetical protein
MGPITPNARGTAPVCLQPCVAFGGCVIVAGGGQGDLNTVEAYEEADLGAMVAICLLVSTREWASVNGQHGDVMGDVPNDRVPMPTCTSLHTER